MQKTTNKRLLSGVLVTLSLVFAFVLASCADTKPQENGGGLSEAAKEEIVQANYATLLAHFKEVDLTDRYASREGKESPSSHQPPSIISH